MALLVLAVGVSSCGSSTEPDLLSDDEQQGIVALVQEQGTKIDAPACQVEVLRIEDATTYGWASCTDTTSELTPAITRTAEAFPFRIDGNQLRKPSDGGSYQEEVRTIFPEDLWSAIVHYGSGS